MNEASKNSFFNNKRKFEMNLELKREFLLKGNISFINKNKILPKYRKIYINFNYEVLSVSSHRN